MQYITCMAVNSDTNVRKLVTLPKTLVQAIDDYRFEQRIKTEAEAIRRLIELGLEASKAQPR